MPNSYHVDPKGNDNNPGTHDEPIRTIASALKRTYEGDGLTIHIRAGTYTEDFAYPEVGIRAPITIRATEPGVVLKLPHEWVWWPNNTIGVPKGKSSLTLFGLTIQDARVELSLAFQSLTISHCTFKNSSLAITPRETPGKALIANCTFTDNARKELPNQYQLYITKPATVTTCRFTKFRSQASHAAAIFLGSDATIDQCIIDDANTPALRVNSRTAHIRDTIAFRTAGFADASETLDLARCLLADPKGDVWMRTRRVAPAALNIFSNNTRGRCQHNGNPSTNHRWVNNDHHYTEAIQRRIEQHARNTQPYAVIKGPKPCPTIENILALAWWPSSPSPSRPSTG